MTYIGLLIWIVLIGIFGPLALQLGLAGVTGLVILAVCMGIYNRTGGVK